MKEACAIALGEIRVTDAEVIGKLLAALADRDVAAAATDALAKIALTDFR